MRVRNDRRRPERQHEPRELVDEQLGRLEVHVRVHETGHDEAPVRVDDLFTSYVPMPAITPSTTAMSPSSHSRVNTERTRPPGSATSAGSSPRATARRCGRDAATAGETVQSPPMEVLTPHSLDEALRLKSEYPEAVAIQGGTDVMVALNFDRARPERVLNLNEVQELRGWSRSNGEVRARSRSHLRRVDAR